MKNGAGCLGLELQRAEDVVDFVLVFRPGDSAHVGSNWAACWGDSGGNRIGPCSVRLGPGGAVAASAQEATLA